MGKTHTYALRNLPYFYRDLAFTPEIVGVCTAHGETALSAAEAFDLGLATDREDDLILNPDVDVIDVCTPNCFHYEAVKKALLAGKHVYCEKPLTVTYAEAAELASLAEERGLTTQVVFHNRYLPAVMRAKRLIEEGRLGRILSFRMAYRHNSCVDPSATGWKLDRSFGGGVLQDLGSHAIDLVLHLCGPIVSVSGRSQNTHSVRTGRDSEEAFYLTAELASGAIGTVEASKLATGSNDDLSLEIFGETGALRFSLMQPNYLDFYDATKPGGDLGGERGYTAIECVGRYPAPGGVFPSVKAPVGWLSGHVASLYAFLNAVHRGIPASPSFDEGAAVQRVIEQAYRSSEQGGRSLSV